MLCPHPVTIISQSTTARTCVGCHLPVWGSRIGLYFFGTAVCVCVFSAYAHFRVDVAECCRPRFLILRASKSKHSSLITIVFSYRAQRCQSFQVFGLERVWLPNSWLDCGRCFVWSLCLGCWLWRRKCGRFVFNAFTPKYLTCTIAYLFVHV